MKKAGMTREELAREGNLQENGKLTRALEDLEYCGFIRKYQQFGKKVKGTIFQLTDFYTLSISNIFKITNMETCNSGQRV